MRRPIAVAVVAGTLALVVWWAVPRRSSPTRGAAPDLARGPGPVAPPQQPDDESDVPRGDRGWRIAGTVVDGEGRPVPSRVVVCEAARFGRDRTLADEAGAFKFARLPVRLWRVSLDEAPWVAAWAYSGDEQIRLVRPEVCSIAGRVRGIRSREEAWVSTDTSESVRVANDGTFRLDNVEPGSRTVSAWSLFRGEAVAHLDMAAGEHREGIRLVFPGIRSWIRVQVLDPDGAPARATVVAEPASFLPATAPTLGNRVWFTESSGRPRDSVAPIGPLLARLLPADRRKEITTDEAGCAVVPAPEEPGSRIDVTVDAEPWPLVTTRATTAATDDAAVTTIRLPRLEPAHVRVVDEDGAGVKSLAVVCCAQRMVSSASDTGDHEFVLAPGQAYSVLVQAMDIQHALLREDVHEWIPPKTDHRLTVTLRPDADRHEAAKRVDARGRVVDRHGEPLGGVLVTPLESVEREGLFGFPYKEFSDDDDVEPPLRDATATDAKGRFRLGTAYEGGYLRFEKPGYGPIAVAVASARDRDTVLPAAARLRIRVNMPGAWNANHWRFDLARDGSRAWTTLVPVPRGRSRFEFAPLGEGSYRAYPLIDAAAEAELRDVGPGRITVRLRTIGFVLERDVDVAEGGTTDVDFTLPDR